MKTKLQKTVLGLSLLLAASIYGQTVIADKGDGFVSNPNIVTTNNPYINNASLTAGMKVGKSDVAGNANTTSAIIPFLLPERPVGQVVTSAQLEVYVNYGREWATTNVDLYGLPYKSATTIFAADHYTGAFATSQPSPYMGGSTATGIEDNYFAKNVANGTLDTPRWEASSVPALADYLNAQYDAGAVAGNYVFLRLSVDNATMTNSHYFGINATNSYTAIPDSNAAKLTLNFGTLGVNKVDKGTLALYPNPVTNSKVAVSLEGFTSKANIEVYSVTGALVHKENVKVDSNKTYEVNLNLKSGVYFMKVSDDQISKTDKLIIK